MGLNSNHAKTWVQHPAYVESDWTTRNPLLLPGEIAFVRETSTGLVTKWKVGPGYFNVLPYQGEVYPFNEVVTNPIGDATGNLFGLPTSEILHRMLNPYQAPVLSNARNNAGVAYQNAWIFEIGQSVAVPITVQVNVSNQSNLLGANPINISAGGAFNNEGSFPLGPVALTRSTPINPTLVSSIVIQMNATHQRGVTNTVTTSIVHYPKIIWGVRQANTIAPADWATLTLRKTAVTNNYQRDYDFGTAGYGYFAIPTMLSPGALIFTDVTDPNAPAGYGITSMGVQTINNGVTSYTYNTFRTTYYINVPSILRVRNA